MIDKICIIGLGMIGGSFAKGLKAVKQIKTIVGFDKNKSNLVKAKELGIIDTYKLNVGEATLDAQIIIIATPVSSFASILGLIKPYIDDKVIISDVGSTKSSIVEAATGVFGRLPSRFVPAHPIAGKEKTGINASDGKLFYGKCVILTPSPTTDVNAIQQITKLWQAVGAKVEIMDVKKHDYLLAMTSHLPHMLAFGLMDYLLSSKQNIFNYTAGGFKDFSRIASSDAIMWRDICLNNGAEIINHIEGYKLTLDKISSLIKNCDDNGLESLFTKVKQSRDMWLDDG